MLEFCRFKLMNTLNEKYFESCSLTLDTSDFIRDRYLKKVQRDLFKEYKRKRWVIWFVYRKFKKDWKQYLKQPTRKNLRKLCSKYNLDMDEMLGNQNNTSVNKNVSDEELKVYPAVLDVDIPDCEDNQVDEPKEIKDTAKDELEPL